MAAAAEMARGVWDSLVELDRLEVHVLVENTVSGHCVLHA